MKVSQRLFKGFLHGSCFNAASRWQHLQANIKNLQMKLSHLKIYLILLTKGFSMISYFYCILQHRHVRKRANYCFF